MRVDPIEMELQPDGTYAPASTRGADIAEAVIRRGYWVSGFFAGLILGMLFGAFTAHAETIDGKRIRVLDGDTVALPCAEPKPGCSEKIRLYAIDAPESYRSRCDAEEIQGLEAKQRLAQLLRNQIVTIKRGEPGTGRMRDRYRRTLGALVTPAGDVAEIMLREGVVLPWKTGRAAKAARLETWCGVME